jgi:hypothetical protein
MTTDLANIPSGGAMSSLDAMLAGDEGLKAALIAEKKKQDELKATPGGMPPFKCIKLPRGAGKAFTIKMDNAEYQLPYMIAHVIHIQPYRIWFVNNKVICQSDDGKVSRKTGVQYPCQKCDECPKSQFVNQEGGKSIKPVCTNKTRLFFVPMADVDHASNSMGYKYPINSDGSIYNDCGKEPMYIDLPPTSKKAIGEYIDQCSAFQGKQYPYKAFISMMRVESTSNAAGTFSKLAITPFNIVEGYQFKMAVAMVDALELEKMALESHDEDSGPSAPASATVLAPAAFTPPASSTQVAAAMQQQAQTVEPTPAAPPVAQAAPAPVAPVTPPQAAPAATAGFLGATPTQAPTPTAAPSNIPSWLKKS